VQALSIYVLWGIISLAIWRVREDNEQLFSSWISRSERVDWETDNTQEAAEEWFPVTLETATWELFRVRRLTTGLLTGWFLISKLKCLFKKCQTLITWDYLNKTQWLLSAPRQHINNLYACIIFKFIFTKWITVLHNERISRTFLEETRVVFAVIFRFSLRTVWKDCVKFYLLPRW